MKVLVTGGAGYIGSHTVVELLDAGHQVVVVDNLSNSSSESIRRVEKITGKHVEFHVFDVRDAEKLNDLFAANDIDAVVHFAGLKAVGESVRKPLQYYENNLVSTLVLLDTMQSHHVPRLIFSSSATVYGEPRELPLTEAATTGQNITNPYGQTKYMIEQILKDFSRSNPSFEITILRYFNPIGAHDSGSIGEDPQGIPNNLMPYIAQVAVGKLNKLHVFGNDYDTPDGTGVRDYIHVTDLAKGHLASLEHSEPGVQIYNLGTGRGVSVLELVSTFSESTGQKISFEIVDRRPGDIASCYASAEKARRDLNWSTKKSLSQACTDTWRWQSHNPNGYDE